MTVLACSGHRTIPGHALPAVRTALAAILDQHTGTVAGVCSLAVGADQLFAELLLERGGELQVVLPSKDYESTFDSVDRVRYERLLAAATTVHSLPFAFPSDAAFLAAGREIVDRADVLIAVWDGGPARGVGGTGDVVAYANDTGTPVRVVWPPGVERP